MHETVNRVKRQLSTSEFAIMTHASQAENKAEESKIERVLRDGAFLVRDREDVVISWISSVSIECRILDEALSFVKKCPLCLPNTYFKPLRCFCKRFWWRTSFMTMVSHASLTFVRSGFLVKDNAPSQYHYHQERCCTTKLDAWPKKVAKNVQSQQVRSMQEFEESFCFTWRRK